MVVPARKPVLLSPSGSGHCWRRLVRKEVGFVPEHVVQHHRQLAGQRTRAFLGPARLATASAQDLRSEPLTGPGQDDVGRLVERGSHTHIADLRDATTVVGLARLILLRCQSEMRPHCS